jgi:hypothetical protein
MTEPSTSVYLPDKVRITASYRVATGDLILAGMPEAVEIELNDDAVPTEPAERIAFLTSLVDSLFREDPAKTSYQVEIRDSTLDPDRLHAIAGRTRAKAGQR